MAKKPAKNATKARTPRLKPDTVEPGYIYLILAAGVFVPGTKRCKIGKSIDWEGRLKQLTRAQPCTSYTVLDKILCTNQSQSEALFHRKYNEFNAKVEGSREWFDFPPYILAQVKQDFKTLKRNRAWSPLPPLSKEPAPKKSRKSSAAAKPDAGKKKPTAQKPKPGTKVRQTKKSKDS